ncbi:MAG TPA: VOC family protein [Gemmatimonadales bacterium]|jgi:uncharacterized glyoxalase superfamily protein PhnB|nr:VOC family protein [Gemmatimonadales bacterium]
MTTATLQAQSFSVMLTANDLDRSLRFYGDGLGFAVVQKYEDKGVVRGAMLEAGGAKLGLSQDDFAKGRNRIKGVGMGLYLETTQDLAALAQRVKNAGIAFEQELGPLPWGPMAFTVKDPDGFKLTLASPS